MSVRRMKWCGWGDPEKVVEIIGKLRALVDKALDEPVFMTYRRVGGIFIDNVPIGVNEFDKIEKFVAPHAIVASISGVTA